MQLAESFPFGWVELGVSHVGGPAPSSQRKEPFTAVKVPVDAGLVGAIFLECQEGALIETALRIDPKLGTVGQGSGQYLDAYEIESPGGMIASVGMRDTDWITEHLKLKLVSSNRGGNGHTDTFAAERATRLRLEVAVAWITQPKTEDDRVAPWLAVDTALWF